MKCKSRELVLFPIVFTLFILSLASCSRGPAEEGKPVAATASKVPAGSFDWDKIDDPYGSEKIAAYLDSVAVSADEIERFRVRILGNAGSSHGHSEDANPLFALPAFRRYFAVVREGKNLGLQNESSFLDRFELARTAIMAIPFQRWLLENAPVDADDLVRKIPEKWVQINFAIHSFSTEQKARDARERIRAGEKFGEIKGDLTTGVEKKPETGLIFPGSGFFDKWDDTDIFNLSEGDIYGPMKTGLGWGIVLVKERHDLTDGEREGYMAKQRQKLSSDYAAGVYKDYYDQRKIKIDEEALSRAVFRELTLGGYSDENVAYVDSLKITYRSFRLMKPVSYSFVRNGYPMALWVKPVKGDLMAVIQQVVMGMMARDYVRQGKWGGDVTPDIVKTLYDYRKTFLYYEYLDRLRSEVNRAVSDKELGDYYQANKAEFTQPARVEITYIFTKDGGMASILREKLADSNFQKAASAYAMGNSPHSGTLKDAVKRATVYQGDKLFSGMQEKLFGLGEGNAGVLEGDMGYYLVEVDASEPKRQLVFDEAKKQVLDRVISLRLAQHVNKAVDDLSNPVKVAITPEFEDKIPKSSEPEPDLPHPDLG